MPTMEQLDRRKKAEETLARLQEIAANPKQARFEKARPALNQFLGGAVSQGGITPTSIGTSLGLVASGRRDKPTQEVGRQLQGFLTEASAGVPRDVIASTTGVDVGRGGGLGRIAGGVGGAPGKIGVGVAKLGTGALSKAGIKGFSKSLLNVPIGALSGAASGFATSTDEASSISQRIGNAGAGAIFGAALAPVAEFAGNFITAKNAAKQLKVTKDTIARVEDAIKNKRSVDSSDKVLLRELLNRKDEIRKAADIKVRSIADKLDELDNAGAINPESADDIFLAEAQDQIKGLANRRKQVISGIKQSKIPEMQEAKKLLSETSFEEAESAKGLLKTVFNSFKTRWGQSFDKAVEKVAFTVDELNDVKQSVLTELSSRGINPSERVVSLLDDLISQHTATSADDVFNPMTQSFMKVASQNSSIPGKSVVDLRRAISDTISRNASAGLAEVDDITGISVNRALSNVLSQKNPKIAALNDEYRKFANLRYQASKSFRLGQEYKSGESLVNKMALGKASGSEKKLFNDIVSGKVDDASLYETPDGLRRLGEKSEEVAAVVNKIKSMTDDEVAAASAQFEKQIEAIRNKAKALKASRNVQRAKISAQKRDLRTSAERTKTAASLRGQRVSRDIARTELAQTREMEALKNELQSLNEQTELLKDSMGLFTTIKKGRNAIAISMAQGFAWMGIARVLGVFDKK